MAKLATTGLLVLLVTGCATTTRHEFDLSHVEGFQWNGQLRITRQNHGLLAGWKVEHIELLSDCGEAVSIDASGHRPTIHLIGDRDSHARTEVKIVTVGWLTGRLEVQEHRFRCREEWGASVDGTVPYFKWREKTDPQDEYGRPAAHLD